MREYIITVKVELFDSLAGITDFEEAINKLNEANKEWMQAEIIEARESKLK